ncbi:MAG TPA: Nif3-like dinuclear metal center hexameric protein [Polyangiaceae bacterium]|nr:Nif3-like dinuclear metal center hexameric protein [Polyangiaceae bacterium]
MPLPLARVVTLLERLAPPAYAEEWDNVGLLLEPLGDRRAAGEPPGVARVLVTIDLTEAVLDEAAEREVELVVAYHPPLFRPIKRLGTRTLAERAVQRSARAGVAIYSPHTALDAAPGGVNDWLADGAGAGERAPLVDARVLEQKQALKLVTFVPPEHADRVASALARAGAGVIGEYTECSSRSSTTGTFLGGAETNPAVGARGRLERVEEIRLEMVCPEGALGAVARVMRDVHPYEEPAWDVYALAPRPGAGFGMGRGVTLDAPVTLETLVGRLKAHLGRSALRVAATEPQRAGAAVRSVAFCAGSGAGIFERAPGFDVYVTGELSHHAVLATVGAGASVVLAEHSSSERGFLPIYARKLAELAEGALEVAVSERDREPLESW